jgi:hypothetical protein
MSAKKIMQQAAEHAVVDRLKLAADHIRAARAVPDVAICDAIGDSAWFREYCNICLQAPIANSFLGCILFGWQLCEEYRRLADDERVKVYQA